MNGFSCCSLDLCLHKVIVLAPFLSSCLRVTNMLWNNNTIFPFLTGCLKVAFVSPEFLTLPLKCPDFYSVFFFFLPQTAFSRAFLYSHGCGLCTVVNKAAGYLQQHLPALFPLLVSTLGLNISCCVFSGGLSGGAEEEEGSLPPAAVRRLTGPLPSDFMWRSQLTFAFFFFFIYALNKSKILLDLCSTLSLVRTLNDWLVFKTNWYFKHSPGHSSPNPPPPLLQVSFHSRAINYHL